MFKQGDIVGVRLSLGVWHMGVATESGTVISASKRTGRVEEESALRFSGGLHVTRIGYPSDINPWEVVAAARAAIGRPWKLVTDNCQHFASECHGVRQSPQLRSLATGFIIAGLCWFLLKRSN